MTTTELVEYINQLKEKIDSLTMVSSPQYDNMPSVASKSDITASKALTGVTLHEDYLNAVARLYARLNVLTENERAVYLGKLSGKSTKELAEQMFYSEAYIYKLWCVANRKVN